MESLFRIERPTPAAGQSPPLPENKRVWASLLKGKTAVIEEVAQEMQRRDPQGVKTRVAVTDGERALQILVEGTLGVTLILDLVHVLEKLWKAAYVFHAEGSLEAELWVLDRTLRILFGDVSQVSGRQGNSPERYQTRPHRGQAQDAARRRGLPTPQSRSHAL